MNRYLLVLLLIISGIAYGSDECGDINISHAERRGCWQILADSTAAELAVTQTDMKKRIVQADVETIVKDRILQRFLESVQQFSRYRTTQCEFEASVTAGGNSAGDLRLQCEVRLNRTYVSGLKELQVFYEQ